MYSFLIEQTNVVKNNDLHVITESVTESGTPKVIFKATLQEAGVVNQNKRRYSSAICESIVDQLSPKATSRNLLMEVDHPMSGTEEEMKRKNKEYLEKLKNGR